MRKAKPVLAWHFVGPTLRDGRPVPADGVVLRHKGKCVMCESGLHASRRIIDALRYAPGSTICRVEMRDVVEEQADKLVACERVILWRVDGDSVLREFARDSALDVLHLWATAATRDIDTVIEYLLSDAEELRAAAYAAARAAADAAAYVAAYVAAYAAARAAAYVAAYAAARAAAYAAAYVAAYAAARAAADAAQEERLVRLITSKHEETT